MHIRIFRFLYGLKGGATVTAALIIATGSTPDSEPLQPLKLAGEITAVERLMRAFQQAGAERVLVACSAELARLKNLLPHEGAAYMRYSGSSLDDTFLVIREGLRHLQKKCRRAFIAPVNVPLFSQDTLERMAAVEDAPVVPTRGGKEGYPFLLPGRLLGAVADYTGPGGLAEAVAACGDALCRLEVPDEGVLLDVQKQGDFEQLLQQNALNRIHPEVRLWISTERYFFGPGPYQLLGFIGDTGSLREACEQMGISYSKGWRILETLERHLGRKVVTRQRGGNRHGHCQLTPAGRQLMDAYRAYSAECKEQIQILFEKHFDPFL